MSTPDTVEVDTRMIRAAAPQKTTCRAPECKNKLAPADEAFVDLERGYIYCPSCGVRLRYHRKKGLLRGEPLLVTFADVEARLG